MAGTRMQPVHSSVLWRHELRQLQRRRVSCRIREMSLSAITRSLQPPLDASPAKHVTVTHVTRVVWSTALGQVALNVIGAVTLL